MKEYAVSIAVRPSVLQGEVTASPSKSQTHRALICGALADGISIIHNPLICDDTEATLEACETIGAKILTKSEEKIVIKGISGNANDIPSEINCRESGSTLRFFAPIVAALGANAKFTGRMSLSRRPMEELMSALEKLGQSIEFITNKGTIPFRIRGVSGGSGKKIEMRGDISSQFISGLLFALPLLKGESEISLTSNLESRDYVELTIEVLEKFGIEIERSEDMRSFKVNGNQKYHSTEFNVEGDYSSSAFMLVAGALSGGKSGVRVTNLRRNSRQGDRRIVEILERMGAKIEITESSVTVKKSLLSGCVIEGNDIPDLVPVLSIAASLSDGNTKIVGVERLRLKESDRISAIITLLNSFGCRITNSHGALEIQGNNALNSQHPLDFEDHRLVMAACIAGLVGRGETLVRNPTAVKKSYPEFFDHIRKLGGDVMTISNSIGNNLKLRVYGESHGKRIGVFLDGVPKGIQISGEWIQLELDRRKSTSSLTTPRREPDNVEILGGVDQGISTGETIRLEIKNMDVKSDIYEKNRNFIRPGHADFTARQKYGSVFDYRGGGFLSGRMTACFVAAGAIAKKILEVNGIRVMSHIVQIGKVRIRADPSDAEIELCSFQSTVKCTDVETAREMESSIETARREGDSLGGTIECRIIGLPVGVGEPVFHSLEAAISQAIFAIPAVKGIEFGSGFKGTEMRGSENNDPVSMSGNEVITLTNNAGGILGGISNGMPVVFRVAIKPTSSIAKEQRTIDFAKSEDLKFSVKGRHDPCIAVRAPPVVEAMAAIATADIMMAGDLIENHRM